MKIRRLTKNKGINVHSHSCATSPHPFGSCFTLVSAVYGLVTSLLLFLRAQFLNADFSRTAPTNSEEVCLKSSEFHLGEVEMSHKREALVRKKSPKNDFKAAPLNIKTTLSFKPKHCCPEELSYNVYSISVTYRCRNSGYPPSVHVCHSSSKVGWLGDKAALPVAQFNAITAGGSAQNCEV